MNPKPIKPTLQHPSRQTPKEVAPATSPPAVSSQPREATTGSRGAVENDSARLFRPLFRPPMALLEVLDDGSKTGESVRIRADSLTIGRETGDVVIPHDAQVSGTHAQIARRVAGGEYTWHLTDLNSTNGTFVRIAKAPLVDGQVVVIGSHRYEFRAPAGAGQRPATEPQQPVGTSGWQTITPGNVSQMLSPQLARLSPDGTETLFPIEGEKTKIGRAVDNEICLKDDPAVSDRHGHVMCNRDGRYLLVDDKSLNGVWVAVHERKLGKAAEFQIGEQRFRFRVTP